MELCREDILVKKEKKNISNDLIKIAEQKRIINAKDVILHVYYDLGRIDEKIVNSKNEFRDPLNIDRFIDLINIYAQEYVDKNLNFYIYIYTPFKDFSVYMGIDRYVDQFHLDKIDKTGDYSLTRVFHFELDKNEYNKIVDPLKLKKCLLNSDDLIIIEHYNKLEEEENKDKINE